MRISAGIFLVVAACSSGGPSFSSKDMASSTDMATMSIAGLDMTSGVDLAGPTPDMTMNVCQPPTGATCPTTAGNCKGIGKPCTEGGGECAADGNSCDKDLDSSGEGVCVKPFGCAPNMGQCGTGATCCQTASTSGFPVCIPNACLPSDCTAE